MSIKEKAGKVIYYTSKALTLSIIFVLGAVACKYLAPDYQEGSAAKLEDCAKSQNVYRWVLVAVEDESD